MRKFIVAGNWKMNLQKDEASKLVSEIAKNISETENFEVVCIPPFPYLFTAKNEMKESPALLGAQDVSPESKGAFTGEVCAAMLKDAGCKFVVVGHSERRQYHGEQSSILKRKVARILEQGLSLIFCIGETLPIREQGNYKEYVAGQLVEIIEDFNENDAFWNNLVIAYEPVWAIGTGKTATAEQAQEMCEFLREKLKEIKGSKADEISILYGGSVKPENTEELTKQKDIDGFLVGGASLKAESFLSIINNSLDVIKNK